MSTSNTIQSQVPVPFHGVFPATSVIGRRNIENLFLLCLSLLPPLFFFSLLRLPAVGRTDGRTAASLKTPKISRSFLLQIFSNLVRKNIENFVQYVEGEPLMVKNMIGAYGNTDIALHGGAMLRECIRYEKLARMTLYDETLWLFFDQVNEDSMRACGLAGGSILSNSPWIFFAYSTLALWGPLCFSMPS